MTRYRDASNGLFSQVPVFDTAHALTIGHMPVSSRDQKTRIKERELYKARLGLLSQGAERSLATHFPFSPWPLKLSTQFPEDIRKFHVALDLAITNVVDRWWTDHDADLPSRMPLEPREEELLKWVSAKTEEGQIKPFASHKGIWRPDLLLYTAEDGAGNKAIRVCICEINARFPFNMLLTAAYGHQSLLDLGVQERGYHPATDPEDISDCVLTLLNPKLPTHILSEGENCFSFGLVKPYVEQKTGITPRNIRLSDLNLFANPNSKTGYDLYCRKSTCRDCHDEESGAENKSCFERIHQVVLQLNQKEIASLPTLMLQHLALHSINDLRSIYLAHDKRMLSIVREELEDLVHKQRVLTPRQADLLRDGIVTTFRPGSTQIDTLIDQSRDSKTVKDNYIVKPIRSGMTQGIRLGEDMTAEEWESTLESIQDSTKAVHTKCIIQHKIEQPTFDLFVSEEKGVRNTHVVGCYHAIDGRYSGLGVWRTGSGKLCSFDNGGMWIPSVVPLLN